MRHPFFQIGLIVDDLDVAMEELGSALGIEWGPPQERRLGDVTCRITFGRHGPPYIELIEGKTGSPWDPDGGYRLDHIGYWTEDVAAESARLDQAGMPLEVDGSRMSGQWRYHRGSRTGLRVELVDVALQPAVLRTFGLT
jgi:hypothetical protein